MQNGKGDRNRSNTRAYREGWDRIFGDKKREATRKRRNDRPESEKNFLDKEAAES